MPKKASLCILLMIAALVGMFFVHRVFHIPKPGFIEVNALTLFKNSEPSPYSIKWGAELARVVDQDGNGVPEATVAFTKYLGRDCNGNPTEEPPVWQDTTVTTNEKGEFAYPPEIWQLEDEEQKPSIRISIEAQGFLPRKDAGVGINYSEDNGQIDIFRIGRIEGAIIDPNGQPIGNAPIWLNPHTYYKNPGVSCGGCYSANVKTDETGGFVFENVPPGLHVVKFPGHAGGCKPEDQAEIIPFKEYATFQMINMKDGEVKSNVFLDLRQSRGTIKGRVVDRYNRPMGGVNAILYRVIKRCFEDGSGWSSSTENLKSAPTDENGNYVLTHIPAGEYQLQGQYPYEKSKNYKSGDPLNIYLAGKQEVTFNLLLERQDDSLPKFHNHKESLFEVPLPEGLAESEMMIVDSRGSGIGGASVVFDNEITIEDQKTRQKNTKEWNGASLTTDSRGVFILPEVLENLKGKWVRCSVSIKAEGFEQRRTSLSSYHLKENRRIDILPHGEIRGQLIGWDGKPVKGAVALLDEMTAYRNPGSASSGGGHGGKTTDEEGRFNFNQVPEGAYVFQYKALNSETNKEHVGSFIIYAQGGQNVDDLVIDLRQDTCAASGRVLDRDGNPVKNVTVRLSKSIQWGYDGYCTVTHEFYRSEKTNRKGNYVIENIRPGVYEIEAVLEGDKRRTSDKMTIAVSDGQTIELDVHLKKQ